MSFLKTATIQELAKAYGLVVERIPADTSPRVKGQPAGPAFKVYWPDAPEHAQETSARNARALICRMGGSVTIDGDPID